MTQQAQAETYHSEGLQRFSEARDQLVKLHEKREAGELSAEAFTSESQELDSALEDAQRYLELARSLNTIDRGSAELQQLQSQAPSNGNQKPEYLRPMGEGSQAPGAPTFGGSGQAPIAPQMLGSQQHFIGGYGLDQRQLLHVSRVAGVQPHNFHLLTGRDRSLLNRWLRGPHINPSDRLSNAEENYLATRSTNAEGVDGQGREHLNVSPYIDRDGGYVTAHEVRNEIIGHLRDRRHIRSRARVIATNASTVAFPTFKVRIKLKKTRANKGKVDGSGSPSIRDILGKTEFNPSGRMETIKVPEELIEDLDFDLLGFLSEEISLEAFDDEEQLFLTGTGVNEPYGVLSTPITGVPHTGAGTGNADFKPEDIKTLPFELREVFRSGGVWMANRSFYKKVTVMRTDEGGAGTGQFLFQPGLRAGDPPTLGGYETLESEFFPDHIDGGGGASQNAGDPICLFGDWRQYWIVDRLGLQLKVLDQAFATEMQIGFRYRKRLDGAPVRLESWVTLDRK